MAGRKAPPNARRRRRDLTDEIQQLERARLGGVDIDERYLDSLKAELRLIIRAEDRAKQDRPATGKPFTSETAKAAAAARIEKKQREKEQAENEAAELAALLDHAELTEKDRALALRRLRELVAASRDEKVAKDAAKALLDQYGKENQDHGPSVVRYESAFIDPEAS